VHVIYRNEKSASKGELKRMKNKKIEGELKDTVSGKQVGETNETKLPT